MVLELGQGQNQALGAVIAAYSPEASVELIADLAGTNRVICVHTFDSRSQPTAAA